jgi:hypothetical protein
VDFRICSTLDARRMNFRVLFWFQTLAESKTNLLWNWRIVLKRGISTVEHNCMEFSCCAYKRNRQSYPCNRPRRPIGLWDVEASIFPRLSGHIRRWGCQPYAPTGRRLLPGRSLVLISVRGWVDTKAIVWLEGLGELKNPMTSSVIEPATFQLVS